MIGRKNWMILSIIKNRYKIRQFSKAQKLIAMSTNHRKKMKFLRLK